jgi:hypothetical protein
MHMAKPRVPKNIGDDNGVTASLEAASATPVGAEANGNGSPARKTVRKKIAEPEVVKAEARMNVVPINMEDEIRRLAYLLSERRGFEPGHEAEDWLAAEHEIRQRYHQQSA